MITVNDVSDVAICTDVCVVNVVVVIVVVYITDIVARYAAGGGGGGGTCGVGCCITVVVGVVTGVVVVFIFEWCIVSVGIVSDVVRIVVVGGGGIDIVFVHLHADDIVSAFDVDVVGVIVGYVALYVVTVDDVIAGVAVVVVVIVVDVVVIDVVVRIVVVAIIVVVCAFSDVIDIVVHATVGSVICGDNHVVAVGVVVLWM